MGKHFKKETEYNVEAIVEAFHHFGTFTAMAKELKVSLSTVSNWIDQKSAPSPQNCLKIEKATKGKVKARDIRPDYDWDKVS